MSSPIALHAADTETRVTSRSFRRCLGGSISESSVMRRRAAPISSSAVKGRSGFETANGGCARSTCRRCSRRANVSSGFGRSERALVARSGSTSTSSGLTISDTPAVSTRLRLSPGLVAGVVSPATSFTRSRYPVVALSTLPPFLNVETEDELAHSGRQPPLLNRKELARFVSV